MGAFLSNIRYVAWGGLAVAVLFLLIYALGVKHFQIGDAVFWEGALRWGHVLVGIMWIGHLYYFNFTQIPNVPKIPEEHRGPAISKVIAPAALFWFRWGAALTLITGLLLAWNQGYLVQALTLGAADQPSFAVAKHVFIGIGMWLGIIMFLNVWVVIWPAQQKALNIDNKFPDLPDRPKFARTAMLFSRTNTFLSVPLLVAMTGASTFQ
ncbi:MAG: urate hydroxylase PuuD [Hyphomonadaceae bacterium]